jgi:3-hydroxybutyryl-CoA dehydrogenase
MKTGRGFYEWTPETLTAERARYNALLRAGLKVLESELPPVDPD